MQVGGGVDTATALVFVAGIAGAGCVGGCGSGDFRVRLRVEPGFVLRNGLFGFGGAFGLEFAELGDGAVEDGEGLGAGAVDGGLGGVGDASGLGFGPGAAAETPGGAEDFGREGFFEGVGGAETGEEGGVEVVVFGLLFRADGSLWWRRGRV